MFSSYFVYIILPCVFAVSLLFVKFLFWRVESDDVHFGDFCFDSDVTRKCFTRSANTTLEQLAVGVVAFVFTAVKLSNYVSLPRSRFRNECANKHSFSSEERIMTNFTSCVDLRVYLEVRDGLSGC